MLTGQRCVLSRKSVVRELCLLALALSSCQRTLASPIRDDSPIQAHSNQVRDLHLYADNGRSHLYLQITPGGEVSGTQEQNIYSVLQMKSERQGVVIIRGMQTTLYLCMDSKHHLYGSVAYKKYDCDFREEALVDGYNWYYSEKYPVPLSLTPTRGRKMMRFMPLQNTIPIDTLNVDHQPESYADKDNSADDPFKMKYEHIVNISQDT